MGTTIAVPCRLAVDTAWCPALVGVRRGYIDALLSVGAIPLLIPPQAGEPVIRQLYAMANGVLLPGGADVDPQHYGELPHPKLGAVEAERDRTELALARWAVADGKPLFAICRGMQVLNVALGGTLYQDINSQHTTVIEHERGAQQQCWEHLDHVVALAQGSRLAELLGTEQMAVNTLHHQALKEVAPRLKVVGRAPDGIIEAVELDGDTFVVGVQCHPEQLWQSVEPRWLRVFSAFVAAAEDHQMIPMTANQLP